MACTQKYLGRFTAQVGDREDRVAREHELHTSNCSLAHGLVIPLYLAS